MGVWGYGLFQSDHDFDMLSDLGHEAGLTKLEEDAQATSKAEGKSDEDYLDSGILVEMIAKEAKVLSYPSGSKESQLEQWLCDPCYVYVLLDACAITPGLQRRLPRPDALQQMEKALFGPNGYSNGKPYDFESKALLETANSRTAKESKSSGLGWRSLNRMSAGGFCNTGMTGSTTSVFVKELREQINKPGVCGSCGAEQGHEGNALLVCSKCKDRK
ncbi:hypothetical protein EJ02DRAFT_441075 [Clathrospora elynae]|uniref:Uncharacterized protein n=1 Tax=Clathrospora elynae TaxID=706981 RepID=A0A6A5T0E7_9PLEO|nr:hypothetical protein EJ02DRAFT_441075 [Clathrospora elynae]